MKRILPLLILLLGGCVTRRECLRYAEQARGTGRMEGLSEGAKPWEASYLACDRELSLLKASSTPFGKTAHVAARETDYELRDREKALAVYKPLTGDECMMILQPRIDRLQEQLDGFMKVGQ